MSPYSLFFFLYMVYVPIYIYGRIFDLHPSHIAVCIAIEAEFERLSPLFLCVGAITQYCSTFAKNVTKSFLEKVCLRFVESCEKL